MNILSLFLKSKNVLDKGYTSHKAEVLSVCITEFDEKVYTKGIREEGVEEGIEIGRARGRARGKAETILELLEDYGEPSETLRELIMEQTDLSVLKQWLKLAARVKSIEEFEKKINLVEAR